MQDAPEDRPRTISMLKAWGLWPLDSKHRPSDKCCCRSCFGKEQVVPDELQARRKRRVALPWEEDAA